jgi:hypothetical protein
MGADDGVRRSIMMVSKVEPQRQLRLRDANRKSVSLSTGILSYITLSSVRWRRDRNESTRRTSVGRCEPDAAHPRQLP